MNIVYSPEYDTLSITFAVSENTICLEDASGVLYRVDPEKEQILGITVLGLVHRCRNSPSSGFDLAPYFDVHETDKLKAECREIKESAK